jgi:hypothetical protein
MDNKYTFTQHARERLGQRGIPAALVGVARRYGRIDGDRWILDRRSVRHALDELAAERALLMKVLDKGGIAVAEADNKIITAFNLEQTFSRE